MEIKVGDILRTVAASILQIAVFCLIGYIAARRGILDVKVRRQMSRVNVAVFTPALMFGKVAFSLTPQILSNLWVIPVGYLILSCASAAVAWALGTCFRLSKIRRNLAVAGATFMNSNTLPIALMQTMSSSPFLKWKADDTSETILERSFQYLVLCTVLGALLRWSVGITLLNSSEEPVASSNETVAKANTQHVPMATNPATPLESNSNCDNSHPFGGLISRPESLVVSRLHREVNSSYLAPMTPNSAMSGYDLEALTPATPSGDHAEFQNNVLINPKTGRGGEETRKTKCLCEAWRGVCRTTSRLKKRLAPPKKFLEVVGELLNPPLLSSLAAIFVACITPLQQGLGKIRPLRDFISMAGAVAIPLTLVLLGAFFYRPPKDKKPLMEDEKTQLIKEKRSHSRRTFTDITLTLLARHIITPLIMLPILAVICQRSHLEVFKDPVFILSATLIVGAPPAITLAQMTSKANMDFFDEMVSKLLLWSYALATPITTICLVLGAMLIYDSIQ
ncbi:uncharacterized protein PGTG_07256 [Puccinia graminis f. sp. tritici CRL 75-36-700-3]|uniref:Auxin efflux carrier n=1 Tax=Puccinia graminis f. sp. tritici (strain CRL 75-36-700-3 / race SCCL) TaxID=418459 RepID=E3KA22_PUCGT|nr:uncharacterized protein PGTG_07256 [Puccinia graminis f. sp. tritici CRL 75-36-700-3]EFP81004.2 hypothetical protein PGTG_07256 [Puccinia graminis f. sp. tritici CRL 75-36-700-3]